MLHNLLSNLSIQALQVAGFYGFWSSSYVFVFRVMSRLILCNVPCCEYLHLNFGAHGKSCYP